MIFKLSLLFILNTTRGDLTKERTIFRDAEWSQGPCYVSLPLERGQYHAHKEHCPCEGQHLRKMLSVCHPSNLMDYASLSLMLQNADHQNLEGNKIMVRIII